MFEKLKREWAQLKKGEPGSRFRKQYERNQREKSGNFGRVARVVIGILLLPVGLFMLAVPGPGLVVIAIGAVLIAREFSFAARALDRVEVRGRKAFKAIRRWWSSLRSTFATRIPRKRAGRKQLK